jgi:hypothetical protein
MTIAIVHGGPLLRVTKLWWPALDEIVARHGITEIWHGAHLDAEGHLSGADLGIDAWARCAGHRVAMFPGPARAYEAAGVDAPRAATRRIKDWLGGHREYVLDGPRGKETSVRTTETVGMPHLVISLPGDSWAALLAVEAERAHIRVERVPMLREPGLPMVVNGHHFRDLRADASGRLPDGRTDKRPPLPEPWIYIGREYAGHKASPLGNPYSKQEHGDAALGLYRRHLWARIRAKDKAVLRALGEITADHHLVCWCLLANGYGQCHGQIVAAAWDWRKNEGV